MSLMPAASHPSFVPSALAAAASLVADTFMSGVHSRSKVSPFSVLNLQIMAAVFFAACEVDARRARSTSEHGARTRMLSAKPATHW